jgi:hypothetical protein
MSDDRFRVSRDLLIKILAALGGLPEKTTKLPATFHGVFLVELPHYNQKFYPNQPPVPGGPYNVYVSETKSTGNRKTSAHRIHVECHCEKLIPFGRLHQHMPACLNNAERIKKVGRPKID